MMAGKHPSEYVGNEYNIYNEAVLQRFDNAEVVRIRVEQADYRCVSYSVVFPREFDGAFLMSDFDALLEHEADN